MESKDIRAWEVSQAEFQGFTKARLEDILAQLSRQNGAMGVLDQTKADQADLITEVKERRRQGQLIIGLVALVIGVIIELVLAGLRP